MDNLKGFYLAKIPLAVLENGLQGSSMGTRMTAKSHSSCTCTFMMCLRTHILRQLKDGESKHEPVVTHVSACGVSMTASEPVP